MVKHYPDCNFCNNKDYMQIRKHPSITQTFTYVYIECKICYTNLYTAPAYIPDKQREKYLELYLKKLKG